MNKKSILIHIAIILSLVLLGIASRAMPHPWNFTPITAIALVLSAYFGWRWAGVAVFAIMLGSDVFLGFYEWQMMLAVYLNLFCAVGLGTLIKRKKVGTILFASLASSLSFFFITNWAVWQFGTMYMPTLGGLMESYTMALPFFRHSLAGDLIYTAVLFGAFEFCLYLKPKIYSLFVDQVKIQNHTGNLAEK